MVTSDALNDQVRGYFANPRGLLGHGKWEAIVIGEVVHVGARELPLRVPLPTRVGVVADELLLRVDPDHRLVTEQILDRGVVDV